MIIYSISPEYLALPALSLIISRLGDHEPAPNQHLNMHRIVGGALRPKGGGLRQKGGGLRQKGGAL